MTDENPPLSGMGLNAWLCRWEPENIEKFIREHGEECKRIIAKLNADKPTNQPDAQASSRPEHQSIKSTLIETSDNAVQPQYQFTGAAVIPSVTPELEIKKVSVPSSSETDVPDGQNSDTVPLLLHFGWRYRKNLTAWNSQRNRVSVPKKLMLISMC